MEKLSKDEAIESVHGLVMSIARRYYGRGVEMDDLTQSGFEGALIAWYKFDPVRGVKFSTYAYPWIEKKIRDTVNAEGRDIRLPQWVHEKLAGPIDRISKSLEQEFGRLPTAKEVADELGIDEQKVEDAVGWMGLTTIDIDSPEARAVVSEEPGPEELANNALRAEAIANVLSVLSERHREVLELRFGLRDGKVWSTREVGVKLGISGSAVAKAEAEALRALRAHPTARRLLQGWI